MTQFVTIDRATLEQLIESLETCSPGDYSTGYVIHPSFDAKAVDAAITAGRAALANAEPVKPIAFGRMIDGDIADVVCPETHEFYEGDYTVPLYTQPLAANNSAKTLKELAVKGCGECFYQDCDFPNCCKPKMRSDILKDTP